MAKKTPKRCLSPYYFIMLSGKASTRILHCISTRTYMYFNISPAYSRVRYKSSILLSVNHSVWSSTFVTINFSVPIIVRYMKPCIVIPLTCSTSTHLDPEPLTYISSSPPISKYVVSKFSWVGHQICYKI